ncbi:hypothetical protein PT974_00890 [Cladobotryum mycophilum]|uniref:Zn(2)-C6 fungal-type domain-containing protein n=1 Tax=Cladobotryum mycophilum TaxID=491253 RepID=A0ABR0T3F1_9HYPO
MSDYYRRFLSSMAGTDSHQTTSPDEMNASHMPGVTMTMNSPMHHPHPSLGYITGYYDPVLLNAPKPPKGRRKSSSGPVGNPDQKHRRTRSGCFMCRSRRVKCDEARPICERCKKGNRECVYPDPQASKGNPNQGTKSKDNSSSNHHASPLSSNEGDDYDAEQEVKLETIHDEEELDDVSRRGSITQAGRRTSTTSSNLQLSTGRQNSETPSQDGKSVSPSASTVTTRSWTPAPHQPSELIVLPGGRLDWSYLPPDFQHYLSYFVENITNYHYGLTVDGDDFFNIILPNIAVQCEPLLNALVGFAAYHVTLKNPNGKLEDFLQYYNRSVTQLLTILKRKEMHNVPVLITILQLATIEEYLGDWVNLMGHQKAAFEIITQIFTPQTVIQSPVGRMCLSWYARFDNTVALLGGFPTEIPREWFTSLVGFYQIQVASNPEELRWKIEERCARLRLISYDMSILYARNSRGPISPPDYNIEHERLSKQLDDWKNTWDPALHPYAPGVLYDHPLFNNTAIITEWNSVVMMHKSQSPNLPSESLSRELGQHAFEVCQNFAVIEQWPSAPAGILIAMQPCLSIAALFLPHLPNHNMWLRSKFALLESLGHIHPRSRRIKMADVFHDPSCVQWWLPNNEGFTSVLQSIRGFADERNAKAVTAQQENLREMKHLFAKLELNERTMDEIQGNRH